MNAGINKTYAALLELTARAISKSQADTDTVLSVGVLSDDEWRAVYEAAVRGGVCALVWDAVQRLVAPAVGCRRECHNFGLRGPQGQDIGTHGPMGRGGHKDILSEGSGVEPILSEAGVARER